MATTKTSRPSTWLVPHPTWVYVEDVKAIARRAGLRVIDVAFASPEDVEAAVSAKDAPQLTLKPEFAPAKPAKPTKEL